MLVAQAFHEEASTNLAAEQSEKDRATIEGNRCADPIVWSRYADLECRNGASAK